MLVLPPIIDKEGQKITIKAQEMNYKYLPSFVDLDKTTNTFNFTPSFNDKPGTYIISIILLDTLGYKNSYLMRLNVTDNQCKSEECRIKFRIKRVSRQGLMNVKFLNTSTVTFK